jgi:hypothetical protein
LVGLAGLQQYCIELFQDKLFVRRADRALAFEQHENVIVVIVVVHVVLQPAFAIDHPIVRQIGSPQTEMIDAWIGVSFFYRVFHLDHRNLP